METKTYRDKSLKVPAIVISVIGAALIVLILYVLVAEEDTANRNVTIFSLGVPVLILFATLLAAWLLIKKRTVTLDSLGAQVVAKRPLGEETVEQFFWRDVTAVNLISETTKTRRSTMTHYRLSVAVSDGREIFLTNKRWLGDDLKNLLADVGAATKDHLGYVWENESAAETRLLIASVPPFRLVSLDPLLSTASLPALFALNAAPDETENSDANRSFDLRTHVKIIGAIYLGFASLMGFFVVLAVFRAIFTGSMPDDSSEVIPIILMLIAWFFVTGKGLWKLDGRFWLHGLIVGTIFMLVLNTLFLFADGGTFARSTGQKIFHLACAAVGLYTIAVLLLPAGRRAFQKPRQTPLS